MEALQLGCAGRGDGDNAESEGVVTCIYRPGDRLRVIYPGIRAALGNSGLPLKWVSLEDEGVHVALPTGGCFTIPRSTLEHLMALRAYRGIYLLSLYLHRYYVQKWGVTW